MLAEFASAFGDADRVVVTDIYAAREKDTLGIRASHLVEKMSHPGVVHIGDLADVTTWLEKQLEPGDVLITMGAGDVWRVGEGVPASITRRNERSGEESRSA